MEGFEGCIDPVDAWTKKSVKKRIISLVEHRGYIVFS